MPIVTGVGGMTGVTGAGGVTGVGGGIAVRDLGGGFAVRGIALSGAGVDAGFAAGLVSIVRRRGADGRLGRPGVMGLVVGMGGHVGP